MSAPATPWWRSVALIFVGSVVSLIAGLFGALLIAPLGLVVPAYLILPLAIGFGALMAALAAAWVGNILASGGRTSTRSRIPSIVIVTIVAALAMGSFAALAQLAGGGSIFPNIFSLILVLVVPVALVAMVATIRFRSAGRSARRDVLLSLGLIAVAVLLIVASIGVVCSVDTCGA